MRRPSLAAALALLASPAGAADISPDTYRPCLGQPRCTIGAATLRAEAAGPAVFAEQIDSARGSVPGLGVMHDPGNGFNEPELQGPVGAGADRRGGERIVVDFAPPQVVAVIVVAHLFNPDDVPGDAAEEALIEGFAGGQSLGLIALASLSATTMRLRGPVGEMNAVNAEAGETMLIAPFLGQAVDRIVFSSAPVAAGDTSDYSVHRLIARPPG